MVLVLSAATTAAAATSTAAAKQKCRAQRHGWTECIAIGPSCQSRQSVVGTRTEGGSALQGKGWAISGSLGSLFSACSNGVCIQLTCTRVVASDAVAGAVYLAEAEESKKQGRKGRVVAAGQCLTSSQVAAC